MNLATMQQKIIMLEPMVDSAAESKNSNTYIHIDDGGKGGIPVIFLHSFGGTHSHWKKSLNHLRETRRAIAIDLRGHGESAKPADHDYSVQAMTDDLEAVVDKLGLKIFILVGHSMGGSIAIEYAGRHADQVAALLLMGTPGKSNKEQSAPIIASLESEKYQEVMDEYMKKLLTNADPSVSEEVMEGANAISREDSINIIKSVFAYDPLPSLKSYWGPNLIVSTDKELQQPSSLAKSFPTVPNKIVEGTSHWIQMDKPDVFNSILDDFLGNIK